MKINCYVLIEFVNCYKWQKSEFYEGNVLNQTVYFYFWILSSIERHKKTLSHHFIYFVTVVCLQFFHIIFIMCFFFLWACQSSVGVNNFLNFLLSPFKSVILVSSASFLILFCSYARPSFFVHFFITLFPSIYSLPCADYLVYDVLMFLDKIINHKVHWPLNDKKKPSLSNRSISIVNSKISYFLSLPCRWCKGNININIKINIMMIM